MIVGHLPRSVLALVCAAAVGLGACATRPDPADTEAVEEFRANNDPLEPLNRGMYFVNEGLDTLVIRPAAEAYRIFLPPELRSGVRNVLGNLRTPVILVNDLLQGETDRAGVTIGRFVLNTTLGVGGIFDVATGFGLPGHAEDFGQTLAIWGVSEGPYLFIPFLGPSNPRDLVGFGVDAASNPLTWISGNEFFDAATNTRIVLQGLDTREGLIEPLDAVRNSSLDPYATIRSAYRQRRAAEIMNRDTAAPAARGTGFGAGTGGAGQAR
ncbi:MlaA family lipoprotein [Falsiroseomonas oryziterrae]|uniref:MlaA family lipoprotein n=1 Tax=Falsiroseomonas oryziterrae TaxID=2911368 RepID=UPI001F360E05|nr:VacJ family lipoprotein [Roseomonas sp. NPKOSM-4]